MPVYVDIISRLDERSAAAAARQIDRRFSDAGVQAGKSTGAGILGEIDKAASEAGSRLTTGFGKQGAESGKAFGRTFGSGAKSSVADAARDINRSLIDGMSGGLSRAGASGAGSLVSGLRSGVGGAGEAGSAVGGAFAKSAGAAVALAGVAIVKGLTHAIEDGLTQLRAWDLMQTQLGIDKTAMRSLGEGAGQAYAHGFGDSVEANLKAIKSGLQTGLITANSSPEKVAQYTQRVSTTAKNLEEDPTAVARGARNLVRTGAVKDYTEALDVLNAAQAAGLNVTGDLIDTTEEYATSWKSVGLSAQDAVGLMKQMTDAGIRNTDLAADSIKELSISVNDGSKQTAQAFAALGLNAEDMTRKFAEGGPAAREALGVVLDQLRQVQDPMQKNLIGLALFKTRWEDAGPAISGVDLAGAADKLGKVAGATDRASDATNAHASSWDKLGKSIDTTISKLERELADLPVVKFFSKTVPEWLQKYALLDDPNYKDPSSPFNPDTKFDPAKTNAVLAPSGPSPALPAGPGAGPLAQILANMAGTGAPMPPGLTAPAAPLPNGIRGQAPVPLAPGSDAAAGGGPKLPPAPVLPLSYTATTGLPSALASAVTRLDEVRHEVAEKQARLNQLEMSNVATAEDITKARNDLAKAQQQQLSAERSLTDVRLNSTKQAGKQLSQAGSEFGNALDKDFGFSKGLGGIVENLVKAVGNALTAPFLTALGIVDKANPNEGSGLIGIAAANGAFGSQYTPAAIAAANPTSSLTSLAGAADSAAAALGGIGGGRGAIGGNVGAMTNLAQSANGKPYTWGGADLTKGLADCSGSISSLVATLEGLPQGRRLFTTENFAQNAPGLGFVPGYAPGNFNVGIKHGGSGGGHMAATLPNGVNFETGGANPGVTYGGNAAGALSPQFTEHWTLPVGGGYAQGAPAPLPPAPSVGLPAAGGGSMLPGMGQPNGLMANLAANQAGAGLPGGGAGVAYPGSAGNGGNVFGGLPLDAAMAATSGLDMMMPGAGAAAKIGIQVANRTIGYAAQNAGILANGIMETLSIGDNPKGSLGAGWIGKIAGAAAGAAPALPNLAGGQKQPLQPGQVGQQGNTINQNDQSIHVTNNGATEAQNGRTIAEHQAAMYAPSGRQ